MGNRLTLVLLEKGSDPTTTLGQYQDGYRVASRNKKYRNNKEIKHGSSRVAQGHGRGRPFCKKDNVYHSVFYLIKYMYNKVNKKGNIRCERCEGATRDCLRD